MTLATAGPMEKTVAQILPVSYPRKQSPDAALPRRRPPFLI